MSTRRLTGISLFTSLMVVFTIILPPIPVPILNINVTLQTFIVMLAGLLLRPTDAFTSILLYVLIGALGLPVFSGYSGGLGVIFGPTGGFIISFPIVAYLISSLKYKKSFYLNIFLTGFFGIIITYFIGIIWFDYYTNKTLGKILYGMLIFLPFDVIKCIMASIIGLRLESLTFTFK